MTFSHVMSLAAMNPQSVDSHTDLWFFFSCFLAFCFIIGLFAINVFSETRARREARIAGKPGAMK